MNAALAVLGKMDSKPAVGKAKIQSVFPLKSLKKAQELVEAGTPGNWVKVGLTPGQLLKSPIKKQLLRFLP